jgi:hypothetical protein
VTVTIKQGASTTQTRSTACSGGAYSVAASPALGQNTYTAQASQTDAATNTGTSTTITFTVDTTAPTATGNDDANGGSTAGKAEPGDTITLQYSEMLNVASVCASWSSANTTAGTLTSSAVVTITAGASSDTVTVSAASCPTLHIGSIALGQAGYVTGGTGKTLTFSGTTISWNGADTLTITLGSTVGGTGGAGTQSGSNQKSKSTYTPDAAITDRAGNGINTAQQPQSGNKNHF